MSDFDRCLFFDSIDLELITPLANAAPELSRTTPEEQESMARRLFGELDAAPLQRGEPNGEAIAAASPLARAEGPRQVGEEGVTVRCPTFDPHRAAAPPPEPFVASPPPAKPLVPSPPVDAGKAGPPKRSPLDDLKITMLAVPIPAELREQLGRLPFKPPTPGYELSRTMKVPVHNPLQGQTTPDGDDSIQKAVAALPFDGNKVVGIVSLPPLSIQQYASLRAELALWPERSDEILRRYRVVNEAARRALMEHWQAELAKSPEARATFEKGVASYTAWLLAQRA